MAATSPLQSPAEVTLSPEKIKALHSYGSGLCIAVLNNKNTFLSKVELIWFGSSAEKFPFKVDAELNMCTKMPFDKIKAKFPCPIFSKLPAVSKATSASVRHLLFGYCEVRGYNDVELNVRKTVEYLIVHEWVGVVHISDQSKLYLLPTSPLTEELGITHSNYPKMLHGLFVKKQRTEMKPLQMSVLENHAAQLEPMSTATRKRRRVSFAPELPTTHKSDDVVITKVVEGNRDLRPLPHFLSERGGQQSTGAASPHLKDTGVPRALVLQGASELDVKSTEEDIGSKAQVIQHVGKTPPGTQAESPVVTPSFKDVATPCVSSHHGQKHSESPPDHVTKQVSPPNHLPDMQDHSRNRLSDEESVASSVSSATSDVITGKRRGRPRGVKSRGEIAAGEAKVQREQKQKEAMKEVIEKEVEGMALRSRKRRRRKTRSRKTVAVAVVAAVTEEVEEGERERESETGEGLGVGETKKRRLAQEDEPQPTPETARDTNHLLYQLLDEQTTPIVEVTQEIHSQEEKAATMTTTKEEVDMQVETPTQDKDKKRPKVAEHCVSEQLQDQAEAMPVDQMSEDSSIGTATQRTATQPTAARPTAAPPTAAQPPPPPTHSSSSHSETSAGDRIYKHLMSDCSEIEEEVISGPYSVTLDMGSELVMDSLGDHSRHPRRVSWAEYKQRRKSATERRDSGGYEPQHQGVGETTTQQKAGLKLGASLESPEKAQHVEMPAARAVVPSASTVTSDSTNTKMDDSQSPRTGSKESPGKEKEARMEMAASTTAETVSLGSQKLSPVVSRTVIKQSPDSKPQISQDATEKVSHSPEKQKLVVAAPTGGCVSAAKESVGDPRTASSLSMSPTAPAASDSTKVMKETEKASTPVVQRTTDAVVSEKEPVAGSSKGGASTKDVIGRVASSQHSISPVQRFSIPVHQGGAQPIAPHTHEPIAPPHTHDPIVSKRQREPIVPQHQHEPSPHFLLPPPHAHPPPHAPPGPHGSWFPPSAWTRNVLGPHIAPPPQPWGPYGGYFHPHQHSGYPPYGPFPPGISPDDIPPPPPDELASRSPSPSISSSHSSRSRSLSRSGTPTGDDSPEVVDDAEREFELTPSTSDATTQATCRTSSQLIQVGSGFKFRSMSTQTIRRPITRSLAIQVNMDPKMYSKRVQTNPPHIVSSFTQTVCKTRSRGTQTIQEPEPPKPLHAGLEALKLMVENVEFSDGEEIVRNLRDYLAMIIGLGSGSVSDYDPTDMSCDEENEDDVFEGDDQSQLSTQPGIPSPVISGASNISEGDLSDLLSEGSPSGKTSATSEPHTPSHPLDPDKNDSHSVQHPTVLDGKAAASSEPEEECKDVGTEMPHRTQVEATTAVDTKADCSTPPPLPPPPLPTSLPPLPPFPAPSLPPPPPPSIPSHLSTLPESQPTGSPCPPKPQQTLEVSVSKNLTTSHRIQESSPVKQLQMVAPLPPIQEEPSAPFERQEVQMHALETACPLDLHNEEFYDSPSVCYVRCMSLPPFKLSGTNGSSRTSSTNSSSNRSTPSSSPGTEFPGPTDPARLTADYTAEDAVQVGTSRRACSNSPPTARRFRKKPILTKEELLAKVRARKSHGGTSLEAVMKDPAKREVMLETGMEDERRLELGKKGSIDMHQLMVNFHKHMAEVETRKVQDASWIRYHPPFSAQYPTIPYHRLPIGFVPVGFELGCRQVAPWDVDASSGSKFQGIHTASESESHPPVPSTEHSLESHSSGPASEPEKPQVSPPLKADDSGTSPGPRSPETSGEGGIHKNTSAESTKEALESGTSLQTTTVAGHDRSNVLNTREVHADKQVPVSDSILESERDTLDHPTPDSKSVILSPSSAAETPNTMYYSVPATPETASHTPTEWFTPSMQFGRPMGTRRDRRSMLGLAAVESPTVSPGERTIPEEEEAMDATSGSLVCWEERRSNQDDIVLRSDEIEIRSNRALLESSQPEPCQDHAKQGESMSSVSQVIHSERHNLDWSQKFREVVFPDVTEHSAHVTAGEVPPPADSVQSTNQQMLSGEEGDVGEGTGPGGCGATKESCGSTDFDASPEKLRGGDKEDFSYSKVESPKILPLQSLYTDLSELNVPPPPLPAGVAMAGNPAEYSDEDEVQQRRVGNRYVPSLQCADTPNVFSLEVESVDSFCDVSAIQEDYEPNADSHSLEGAPLQLARVFQSDKSCLKESDTGLDSPPPFSSGDAVETVETTNVDCSNKGGQVIKKDPQRALVVSIPRAGCVLVQPEKNCPHNHLTSPKTLESSDPPDDCFHVEEGVPLPGPPLPACGENSASHSETPPHLVVHDAEDPDHSDHDESLDSFFLEVATPELHNRLTPDVEVPSSSSQYPTTPLAHSFRMSSFKPSSPSTHECLHTPSAQPPTSSSGEFISQSPEKKEVDQGDEHTMGVSKTRQPSSETALAMTPHAVGRSLQHDTPPSPRAVGRTPQHERSPQHETPPSPHAVGRSPQHETPLTPYTVGRSPQHETPPSPHVVGRSPQHETPPSPAQYQLEHSVHHALESVPSSVFDLAVETMPPQAEDSVVGESVQDQTAAGAQVDKSKGIEENQVDLDHLKPVGHPGVVLPAGQVELVVRSETGGEGISKQLESPSHSKTVSQLLGGCKYLEQAEASQESTEETLAGSTDLSVPDRPITSNTAKDTSSGADPKPTGLQKEGVEVKVNTEKATESDEELEEGEIVDTSDNEPSNSRDADVEVISSMHSPAAEKTPVVEDIPLDDGAFESEAPTIEMAVCDNPAQPPLPQSPPPTHEIGPPPLPATPPPFEAAPGKEEASTSDCGVAEHSSSIRLGKRSPKTHVQARQPPQLLCPKSPPQPFGPNVQPFGPNPSSQPRPLFASHTSKEAAPIAPKPLFPVRSPHVWMLPCSSSNQNPGLNTMALQPPYSEGSAPQHPKPLPLMGQPTSLVLQIPPLMQERQVDGGHQPPCSSATPPHIPQHSGSSLLSGTNSTPCSSSGSKSVLKSSSSSQRSSSDSQASGSSSILGKTPSQEARAVSPRRLSSPSPSFHHHSSASESLPSQAGLRDPTAIAWTQRSSSDSQASGSSSILGKTPSQEARAVSPRRLSSPSPSLHHHSSASESLPSQAGLRDPTAIARTQRSSSESQASGSSSILRKKPSQAAPPRRPSSSSPSLHRPYHHNLDDTFHPISTREELDLLRLHSPYAPPPPPLYRYHRPLPPPLPPQWHHTPPIRHRREFPYDLDSPPFDGPQFGHPEGGFYTYRYF